MKYTEKDVVDFVEKKVIFATGCSRVREGVVKEISPSKRFVLFMDYAYYGEQAQRTWVKIEEIDHIEELPQKKKWWQK